MLSSSLKSVSVFLLVAASAAFAVPAASAPAIVEKRASTCVTTSRGFLTTVGVAGRVVYLHFAPPALQFGEPRMLVEFQSCRPNFGGFNGPDKTSGRIKLPDLPACLAAINLQLGPPYEFNLQPCQNNFDSPTAVAQQFVLEDGGSIYFAGLTNANFPDDYGCETGLYGVNIFQTEGVVEMSCTVNTGTSKLSIQPIM